MLQIVVVILTVRNVYSYKEQSLGAANYTRRGTAFEYLSRRQENAL